MQVDVNHARKKVMKKEKNILLKVRYLHVNKTKRVLTANS